MEEPPADTSPTPGGETPFSDTSLPSETLLNTVPYGLYHLDPDGYLVAVNDALIDLTGYPRDTLLGTHISEFLDAEDVVRGETATRDQLLGGDQERLHLSVHSSRRLATRSRARSVSVPSTTTVSSAVPLELSDKSKIPTPRLRIHHYGER